MELEEEEVEVEEEEEPDSGELITECANEARLETRNEKVYNFAGPLVILWVILWVIRWVILTRGGFYLLEGLCALRETCARYIHEYNLINPICQNR